MERPGRSGGGQTSGTPSFYEHWHFENNRMQPTSIGIGTTSTGSALSTANTPASDWSKVKFALDYGSANNDGNVQTETISVGGSVMGQTFTYDCLNRLTQVSEANGFTQSYQEGCHATANPTRSGAAWTQDYLYDNFGNRAVMLGESVLVSNATPQASSSSQMPYDGSNHWTGVGVSYVDSNNLATGNMTKVNGLVLTYDAENRLTKVVNGSQTVTFTYDGNGRRVTKGGSDGDHDNFGLDVRVRCLRVDGGGIWQPGSDSLRDVFSDGRASGEHAFDDG